VTIAVLAIQAVVFSILSGAIAANKNRSVELWCFLGFLLGLLGFITVLALGEKQSANSQRQRSQNLASRGFNPDQHEKKCPMCAEYIKLEARRCKHCGHEFSDEEVERQIEKMKREIDGKGEMPTLYCERSEITVQANLDGTTCPACGENIDDGQHPTLEDAGD